MKIVIALATALLLAGLVSRDNAGRRLPIPPRVLKAVPGLSAVDLAELQQQIVPLLRKLRNRDDTPDERQKLVEQYNRLLHRRLSPQQLELAARLPRDAARIHRFYRHRLLADKALDTSQRRLLRRLNTIQDCLDGTLTGKALHRSQQNYWQMVYLVLTPQQMIRVNRGLPELVRKAGTRPQDYLLLPGITASQGNHLRAIFSVAQAETTSSRTRLKNLTGELRAAPHHQKAALRSQIATLRLSLLKRRQQMYQDLKSVLTPHQRQVLASYPPGTHPRVLFRKVGLLLRGLELTPHQRRALRRWTSGIKAELRRERPELKKQRKAMQQAGPSSPMGMQRMVALRKLQEPIAQAGLAAARKLVIRLDNQQLQAWLVGSLPATPAMTRRFKKLDRADRRRVRTLLDQGQVLRADKLLEQAK